MCNFIQLTVLNLTEIFFILCVKMKRRKEKAMYKAPGRRQIGSLFSRGWEHEIQNRKFFYGKKYIATAKGACGNYNIGMHHFNYADQ